MKHIRHGKSLVIISSGLSNGNQFLCYFNLSLMIYNEHELMCHEKNKITSHRWKLANATGFVSVLFGSVSGFGKCFPAGICQVSWAFGGDSVGVVNH